jgi:hypothetical protein
MPWHSISYFFRIIKSWSVDCGMDSSWKYNMKRHVENLQGKNGSIVSFMD